MRLSVVTACLSLCLIGFSSADDARASIRKETNIPAEGLGPALNALAKDRNFQIVYVTEEIANVRTEGAVGEFTTEEALKRLLAGTGLTYRYLDDKTVTIGSATTLHERSGDALTTLPGSDDAKASQEGKKSSSGAFRVAQVDQGASASPSAVIVGRDLANGQSFESSLTEIVVTAQRREESIDKVPISISAYNQKSLDDLHVVSLSDLATLVPGLVVTPPAGGTQSNTDVAIRGISSGGTSATTGIYIDETPIVSRQNLTIGYNGSPQPDLFDLDRIEVLRGPQGTLFGAGAMGGAIRYVTPQPNLEESSGYAKTEFSYTDHGDPSYAVGVAYGQAIIPNELGFRVSGWFHSDGGFIDIEDPYTGQILQKNANSSNSYVFRPAFTWAPVDGLTITPAAFIQHQHSAEASDYWVTELPNPKPNDYVTGFGARVAQPVTDDLGVYSLAIKYDMGLMTLHSDTSYTDRSLNAIDDWSNREQVYLGLPPVDSALSNYELHDQNLNWTRAWQQEFRLNSEGNERLSWVAGLYFRHDYEGLSQLVGPDDSVVGPTGGAPTAACCNYAQLIGDPDYDFGGQSLASYTHSTLITMQKALFGEINLKLLPGLAAIAGVRVDHTQLLQQRQSFAGPLTFVSAYKAITLPDVEQTPVTPRFGLTYQYTDSGMLYATAAKGYRAGGANETVITSGANCQPSLQALGLTSAPATYNSDSLWSYELGVKDTFLEKRIAVQASVYRIDWDGIQTTIALPSCGSGFTTNRGRAISQGFDLQITAIIAEGLKTNISVGYDHAYYPNAEYAKFGASAVGAPPLLVAAGEYLGEVVPWTAAVQAEYSHDVSWLWNSARSYLRIDYRWQDSYPRENTSIAGYDPEIEPYPSAPAYSVLNLRLGVLHSGLDLSAFVDNATNSRPLLYNSHWTIGDPLFTATALRPLTAGLTAMYRF